MQNVQNHIPSLKVPKNHREIAELVQSLLQSCRLPYVFLIFPLKKSWTQLNKSFKSFKINKFNPECDLNNTVPVPDKDKDLTSSSSSAAAQSSTSSFELLKVPDRDFFNLDRASGELAKSPRVISRPNKENFY
jgi:hypothetical protein